MNDPSLQNVSTTGASRDASPVAPPTMLYVMTWRRRPDGITDGSTMMPSAPVSNFIQNFFSPVLAAMTGQGLYIEPSRYHGKPRLSPSDFEPVIENSRPPVGTASTSATCL